MEYNTNPHRDDKPKMGSVNMQPQQIQQPMIQQSEVPKKETLAKMSLFSLGLSFGILLVYTLIATFVPSSVVPIIPLLSITIYAFSLVCMVMSLIKERGTRKGRIALFIHLLILTMIITTIMRNTGSNVEG